VQAWLVSRCAVSARALPSSSAGELSGYPAAIHTIEGLRRQPEAARRLPVAKYQGGEVDGFGHWLVERDIARAS
jgi:hypothetical protein